MSRSVQIEPEEVGQKTMITGAINLQVALEFLVAIFGFTAGSVVIVSSLGHDAGAWPIRDNEAAVGALGIGLGLADHPARSRPRVGLIPESVKQALRLSAGGKVGLGLFHQGFAAVLENIVGGNAKGVIQAESLADCIHPGHAITSVAADMEV